MKLRRALTMGALVVYLGIFAAACTSGRNPEGWAAPAVDGSTAYVLLKKDQLAAVELQSGSYAQRWSFPTGDDKPEITAVYGEPLIDGDRLYFASYKGQLFALNKGNGAPVWPKPFDLSGSVTGTIAEAGELLLVGTIEGRVHAIKKSDGTAADGWPEDGIEVEAGVWAAVMTARDRFFVATIDGTVQSYSLADGTPQWSEPFKSTGAVADLALLEGGQLFVPSLNRTIYVLSPDTGQVQTQFTATDWVWTTPAQRGNTVYFGDFAGRVHAVDITTGAASWTYDTGARNRIKARPVIVGDMLVVGTQESAVHFIDLKTGERRNVVPTDTDSGTIRANLVPLGSDAVLVVTTKGHLYRATPRELTLVRVTSGGGN